MSGLLKITAFLVVFMAQVSFAQNIIHVYSPWSDLADQNLHITGQPTGWGATVGGTSEGIEEGGNWYSWNLSSWEPWGTLTGMISCPKGADQNTCNNGTTKFTFASPPLWNDIFKDQKEVWVTVSTTPTDTSLVIGLTPPDARMVWFFSPWGNKSLPRMINSLGDTTILKAVDNPEKCGWFWGAVPSSDISKLSKVQFLQAHTENILPGTGSIDLTTKFGSSDTVYVNSDLTTSNTKTKTGACLDKRFTVHVLQPWRDDKDRREFPVRIRSGNVVNQSIEMSINTSVEGFWTYTFAEGANFSENDDVKFSNKGPDWQIPEVDYPDSWLVKDLWPAGEYEVWIFPEADTLRIERAPVTAYFVNLLNPWNNTAPRLINDGKLEKMKAFKSYCGWFKTVMYEKPVGLNVFFQQALGGQFYSKAGLGDTSKISLDSYFATGDSVWISPQPYPAGPPDIVNEFPGILGDCPERKLSVILFDHNFDELDFEQPESGGCTQDGLMQGMVEDKLVDGLPQKKYPAPVGCSVSHLPTWFVAEEIVPGYTNARCYDLPLEMDEDGFWLADIDEDASKKKAGFFPLDDFYYLDAGGNVPNPNYQTADDVHYADSAHHNYSFTMHVNASFEYIKGQYFEFRGDDDVWVFINDRLVVDIGGYHMPIEGTVDLDTLGLNEGETYNFHIFFAERQTTGSNFKMRTSIDLQTERSFYKVPVVNTDGLITYELRQIVKESGLSCEKTTEGRVDTLVAPSIFTLAGPQFPAGPVKLGGGENYGGIFINEGRSGFTIDTLAIVRNRSLAPGRYILSITHATDGTLTESLSFTVPSYPLPNISFSDSTYVVINPDSVVLGEWAFVPYPIYIIAEYGGIRCDFCSDKLILDGGDSIVFLNEDKEEITSVTLDSGATQIYMMGLRSIRDASFSVSGNTVGNNLVWSNITLKEPPVPIIKAAEAWDVDGDGVADSLYIQYARSITGEDAPDSILYKWGDEDWVSIKGSDIDEARTLDSIISLNKDLSITVFTGDKDAEMYTGALTTYYTYIPEDGENKGEKVQLDLSLSIKDKVGPVITKAEVGLGSLWDTLYVYLSESVRENPEKNISPYLLRMWNDGVKSEATYAPSVVNYNSDSSRATLIYPNGGATTPRAGDSISLDIENIEDFAGNLAHPRNPWVKIKGRSRSQVATIPLVTLKPELIPPYVKGETIKVIMLQTGSTTQQALEATGLPGYLLQYDLGEILQNDPTGDLKPSDIYFDYVMSVYGLQGQYLTSNEGRVSCDDPELFKGDCSKNPGNPYLAWDMRSSEGRLAGTGIYITRLIYKIIIADDKFEDKERTDKLGIERR